MYEIDIGIDDSSPTHSGNFCYNIGAGWVAETGKDMRFELWSEPLIGDLTSSGNNGLLII